MYACMYVRINMHVCLCTCVYAYIHMQRCDTHSYPKYFQVYLPSEQRFRGILERRAEALGGAAHAQEVVQV